MSKKKYPGKLGKKRKGKKREVSLLADDKVKRITTQWALEDLVLDMEGLNLLREHYKVTEKSEFGWMKLSILLARDHVPYFQRDDKRGAPRSGKDELYMKLLTEVSGLKISGEAKSNLHACQMLRSRGSEYAQGFSDAESMVQALKNLKKKYPLFVKLAKEKLLG